jgi:catechol 2,3-dioxygenase-like lactoylglutathione lyase family enzyme
MSATTIFLLIGVTLAPYGGASPQKPGIAEEVAGVGMTVSDLDRAVEFFTEVLTFEKTLEAEYAGEDVERLHGLFGIRIRVAKLRLGDEQIELTEYLTPRGRPIPVDSRSNDRWFQHIAIITSDMDRAYQRLRKHKVRHASTGPQRLPEWNKNAGGIQAFYFHDPDGHVLEILRFPPGKGNAKWHKSSDRLFLGIDHTAIVVSDTDASLAFYRDVLGFEVVGGSENYGTEQEHLNNVFGARLRITSVRPPVGPAIEFLEYLAPRDGRPYPSDARTNDLYHWQTTVVTSDLDVVASRIRSGGFALVSPGVVDVAEADLGFRQGLLVRDADGHAVRIVKK